MHANGRVTSNLYLHLYPLILLGQEEAGRTWIYKSEDAIVGIDQTTRRFVLTMFEK